MTTVVLSMPKEKICFACHQDSLALWQHVPGPKGTCTDCHDAHSSERRMLLLQEVNERKLSPRGSDTHRSNQP